MSYSQMNPMDGSPLSLAARIPEISVLPTSSDADALVVKLHKQLADSYCIAGPILGTSDMSESVNQETGSLSYQ